MNWYKTLLSQEKINITKEAWLFGKKEKINPSTQPLQIDTRMINSVFNIIKDLYQRGVNGRRNVKISTLNETTLRKDILDALLRYYIQLDLESKKKPANTPISKEDADEYRSSFMKINNLPATVNSLYKSIPTAEGWKEEIPEGRSSPQKLR